MASPARSSRVSRSCGFVCLGLMLLASTHLAAQNMPRPDTFTGKTANMSPAGLPIKIDVLEWLDDAGRADVLAALESDAVAERLKELPTVGYLWVDGSPVGYSLKYAHRSTRDDGLEVVTVVTSQPLGTYGREAWRVEGATEGDGSQRPYSVVELDLEDGAASGTGRLSLAANVTFDHEGSRITLDGAVDEPLLVDVAKQPPPYWATQGS